MGALPAEWGACRAGLGPPGRGGWCSAVSSRSRSKSKSKAFTALRAASHFLLLVQEKVTKEKGTPVSRSRVPIEVEASIRPWCHNRPAHPCAGARRGEAVLRLSPPRPCAAHHDRAGATERSEGVAAKRPTSHIHVLEHARLAPGPVSAARREPNGDPKSQEQEQQHAIASLGFRRAQRCRATHGTATEAASLIEASSGFSLLALQSPSFPPSSAGIRRGKARMFEHMDVRVGAGRRIPSNAGHPARCARGAGNPGGPFSWLLLFGQAKRSDSCPEGARKPLLLIQEGKSKRPAPADQAPPSHATSPAAPAQGGAQ
jgi:hypothetical protein